MSERLAKRLLIVGWDAADWIIIDDLISNGGMPVLRKLIDRGARGNLASLEPRLSPLLWSSIATGKTPDQHGILNFVEPNPSGEGLRIISSTSRRTKALWNMLTQSGLRTNVISWYASHPAEPINGTIVSNLFFEGLPIDQARPWPMPATAVHPAGLGQRIAAARTHPASIPGEMLRAFMPDLKPRHLTDSRVNMLAKNLAQAMSVKNAAMEVLSCSNDWDCTMVFFEAIDTIGHNFMQFHPPRMAHVNADDFNLFNQVMYSVYQFHDQMLGELLARAGPDTTLLLLSDHGFFSDHRRPVIDTKSMSNEDRAAVETKWHRPLGMIAMSGPGIAHGRRIFGAGLLDITPTALALLGLPVGDDMRGRPLIEAFERPVKVDSLLSWEMTSGEAGMHPPDLRQDPFEARNALQQLVDLGYMAELPADAQAQADLAWRETQVNLSTVLSMIGEHERAADTLREVMEKYPDEKRFVLGMAHCLNKGIDAPRTLAFALEALQRFPDDSDLHLIRLHALLGCGQHEVAARAFSEIERAHHDPASVAHAFAVVASTLGQWEKAERYSRMAIKGDPESAVMHRTLGEALIMNKRFEDAVESLLNAIEIVHVFPEAHHLLGVALTWLEDYDHAIKSFEVALSMRPTLVDAHRYLATIHRERGEGKLAVKHRRLAEQLIRERESGTMSVEFMRKSAPMGPQEWARRKGLAEEGA